MGKPAGASQGECGGLNPCLQVKLPHLVQTRCQSPMACHFSGSTLTSTRQTARRGLLLADVLTQRVAQASMSVTSTEPPHHSATTDATATAVAR
jgi:hypothetical protein